MNIQDILNYNPTNDIALSAGPGAVTTIFLPAANPNGVILLAFSMILNATVATACNVRLRMSFGIKTIIGGKIDAGAILAVPLVLPKPIFIPAGEGLEVHSIAAPGNTEIFGSYKVL